MEPKLEHKVTLSIPKAIEIESKDIIVEVRTDGDLLGELRISRGSVDWRRSGQHNVNVHRVLWERFAQLLENEPVTRTD
jgi:hypothetical protein